MKIDVKAFTSAINKISDLTSGDKIIPGLMLKLAKTDDTTGTLSVCYSDGHKSLIENLDVTIEEGDYIGDIVVGFEQMVRAVNNCQPSGIIKVGDITFEYAANNVVRVCAEQYMEVIDENGSVADQRKLAVKRMDVSWIEPGSDMKSSILSRMKYDSIFEPDGTTDEYDKEELVDALSRTSVEKGKNVYISANVQAAFVANQAHVTCVPISDMGELSMDDMDAIRADMVEAGTFTEQAFIDECKSKTQRIHNSLVLTQSIAKSIIGILNKCKSEKVLVHRTDGKYCNLIIENDTEKVGIWFEMAQASKVHIGSLDRYSSMDYKSYQVLFIREFLANSIKSAFDSSKNDKVALKFEATQLDNATSDKDLVIAGSNVGASISDTYRVNPDAITDPTGDIETKTFNVSLKVLSDMMAQLKTELVALDINVGDNDTTCIRLAEVNVAKMQEEFSKARKKTEELCKAQGIEFDPNSTPTPIGIKLDYRADVLDTKQFTILSK